MCYVHNSSEDRENINKLLPASFWIDVARQAVDAGMIVLSITGGETLLYPEIDILLEELSHMGILISFNTNGTLIDERQVSRLAKYSLAKINLTLYGGCDETYNKVTGLSDGFSKISKAIELLLDANQNVYLNGVLTKENQKDLPKMIQYAESKGLVLHETSYMFPKRERCIGYDPNEVRLSPTDAARARSQYSCLMNGEKQYRESAAIAVYRDHIMSRLTDSIIHVPSCRAGKHAFAVDWRGSMQPCVLLSAIQEDLRKQSFLDAWEKCSRRMSNISFPKKCLTCSHQNFCPICAAAVYLETGTHDIPPEYLCRYCDEMLRIWEHDSIGIKVRPTVPEKRLEDIVFRGCEG